MSNFHLNWTADFIEETDEHGNPIRFVGVFVNGVEVARSLSVPLWSRDGDSQIFENALEELLPSLFGGSAS